MKTTCNECLGSGEIFNGTKIVKCPNKCNDGYIEINENDEVY